MCILYVIYYIFVKKLTIKFVHSIFLYAQLSLQRGQIMSNKSLGINGKLD